jgi:hypothetical protein
MYWVIAPVTALAAGAAFVANASWPMKIAIFVSMALSLSFVLAPTFYAISKDRPGKNPSSAAYAYLITFALLALIWMFRGGTDDGPESGVIYRGVEP